MEMGSGGRRQDVKEEKKKEILNHWKAANVWSLRKIWEHGEAEESLSN